MASISARNIYKIYPMLSEKLIKTETRLDKNGKKLIVSKRNVLLALDTNDVVSEIIVDNAYLIPGENTSDVAAVEKGEIPGVAAVRLPDPCQASGRRSAGI